MIGETSPMAGALQRRLRRISVALLALLFTACGGGGGTGAVVGGEAPGPLTAPASCRFDLSKFSSPAVYVAPCDPTLASCTDTKPCGTTTAAACKTIQGGIDSCTGPGCAVLVRHGRYATSTSINLRDGVSVIGGCTFDTESPTDRIYRTVIDASPAPGTPALSAQGIHSETTLSQLVVMNRDGAGTHGEASIALSVIDSTGLALVNSTLSAGIGGQGASGASGPAANPGQKGGDGAQFLGSKSPSGGDACPTSQHAGVGRGGNGGNGSWLDFTFCYNGVDCSCVKPFPNSNLGGAGNDAPPARGGPGSRYDTNPGYNCYNAATQGEFNGRPGGEGEPGACAASGGVQSQSLLGAIVAGQWAPAQGGAGGTGDLGSGGGGGSSGGACLDYVLVSKDTWKFTPVQGVAAGAGGGGGCGGNGGLGGQQGGASIGLLLVKSSLSLDQGNAIVPAPGGGGGAGGPGGSGGAGGGPGIGGHGGLKVVSATTGGLTQSCPGPSGNGGQGGSGGPGGGGAGGNGGPSIGIALAQGASASDSSGVLMYAAMATSLGGSTGPGTGGGHQGCTSVAGAAGLGGTGQTVVNFDQLPSPR